METENKVQEVQVLTEEQILALPETVKENVTFLTEEMGTKELVVLNPMVSELLEIRELGSELRMMPINSNGEFNKDNIQEFVDLKKKVRTFRAGVKNSAKVLKEPFAKITKGIIAIEKTFIEEATKVYDAAETEFKAYDDEQTRLAEERQKKKDKALLDKIAEESAARNQAQNQLQKTNVYNGIKYQAINEGMVDVISDAVLNANEGRLKDLEQWLGNTTYASRKGSLDDSILDEDVQGELREHYLACKIKCEQMLKNRFTSIEVKKKNAILEAQQTEAAKPIEVESKEVSNIPIAPNALDTIEACITQIELCKFMDGNGHLLTLNQGWINLKNLIR